MNNPERTTVFLSHSTKDGAFVEKLALALDASGFTPWRCEVDIDKGANFVSKINEGLAQSDVALLVWSPDAANSAWTEQEWTSLLAQQVAEHKIRLAIVMLREHPLPPLLRTSNWIEARWDQAAAIGDTLDWLKRRQSAQRLSGLKAPVYLPDYRPHDFVGRAVYLTRLQDTLTAEPEVFLLYGEPGAGKSMLALRYAWEAQKDFDAVIFQTCGQRPLDAITAELAERLPIDVKTRPPEEQRAAAKAWLRERQSLLVLDDVWPNDEGKVEMRQLEPGPSCSVLYTSRLKSLPGLPPKQSVRVEKFTEAEAQELFHTYLDSVFGESEVMRNHEALLGFAQRVEMLPIAVAVGASLLREKAASALVRAVPKLRLDALTDGSKDVNALFRTAIASQPEREQRLLAACAVCAPEDFWLPLAAQIAELSEDETEDAADRLVHSSLLRVIDRERRRLSLHALLREQVRSRMVGDGLSKLRERHAAALEKLFKDWETSWQECRECLEEVLRAARFLLLRGNSIREGWLSYWGYSLGVRIGELDVALRIMRQQEDFWSGLVHREARKTLAASYGNQAGILADWGRPYEALKLLKKQEVICEELGEEEGLAVSYGNQAVILKRWGRLDDALALHKKEEVIHGKLGKRDGLQRSYGNQAGILKDWGRPDQALELLKKQEAICKELGNQDGLSRSYGNQALILEDRGQFDEAFELLKRQEAICWQLGNKDGLQACYGNQGIILKAWSRLEEALELQRKKEGICLELGNKDSLGKSYANQAVILQELGRLHEAMAMLKKQEAICLELGDRDGLQYSYGIQALILAGWGRIEEAMTMHKKQEAICLELGNKEGLSLSYGNQAVILKEWGRPEEALRLLQKTEAICLELGRRSILATCYANWGLLARAQGDRKTEKHKLEQALAIFTDLNMPRERDAVQTELEKGDRG